MYWRDYFENDSLAFGHTAPIILSMHRNIWCKYSFVYTPIPHECIRMNIASKIIISAISLIIFYCANPSIAEDNTILPDLVKFSDSQTYGYVNKHGEVVIPPKFEKAFQFSPNGLARVNYNGNFGFINTKGEWTIQPQYFAADEFNSNGLAKAEIGVKRWNILAWGGFGTTTTFKHGVINTKGEWVIRPEKRYLGSVSDFGLIEAYDDKSGKIGFIDVSGNWIIRSQFRRVGPGFGYFGLAPAGHDDKYSTWGQHSREDDYGYINVKGEWVIEPRFSYARPFQPNGLAVAVEKSKYGYINTQGQWVIPPKFNNAEDFTPNGLAKVEVNLKTGFINESGDWVIPLGSVYANSFADNGLARAEAGSLKGFINGDGDWIVPPIFQDVGEKFGPNGLVSVVHEGKDRVINTKGEFMPAFDAYVAERTAARLRDRPPAPKKQITTSSSQFGWGNNFLGIIFLGLFFIWVLIWPFVLFGIIVLAVLGLITLIFRENTVR